MSRDQAYINKLKVCFLSSAAPALVMYTTEQKTPTHTAYLSCSNTCVPPALSVAITSVCVCGPDSPASAAQPDWPPYPERLCALHRTVRPPSPSV